MDSRSGSIMGATVDWNRSKVPDYWLRVEPTLAHDKIPHCLHGNVPSRIDVIDNPPDSGEDWDWIPVDPDGGDPLGGTALDAQAGTPGFFYPLGSAPSVTDLATLKADLNMGDGVGPSDAPWDTKGSYIVLGDGSEAHYRLDVWSVGRVP